MNWLWLVFVAIAAVFNAAMDKVENEGFYRSIFRDLKTSFWYKRDSWNKAKNIAGYKFDAWHMAKSLMIFSLCAAIVFYKPIWNPLIDYGIAGVTWIVTFNIFYNRIFKK